MSYMGDITKSIHNIVVYIQQHLGYSFKESTSNHQRQMRNAQNAGSGLATGLTCCDKK